MSEMPKGIITRPVKRDTFPFQIYKVRSMHGFEYVIIAESEIDARRLAVEDTDNEEWNDIDFVTCTQLGTALFGPARIEISPYGYDGGH